MSVLGRFMGRPGRPGFIVMASGMVLAALLGACSPAPPSAAGGSSGTGGATPAGVPVTVLTPVKSGHATAANQASRPFRATRAQWPPAASASVVLRAAAPGQAAGQAAKVAGTPVWVQSVPGVSRGTS